MVPEPANLLETLQVAFDDPALLVAALTHPSFSAEQDPPVPDNQRLEFLGDAVLQLSLTDLLFRAHPSLAEGELTKIRSALTNARTLARKAREIDLGPLLRLGNGEERSGGRARPSNLSDAFEAVLGAVYMDSGYEAVRALCARLYAGALEEPRVLLVSENPKGALQELTQEVHGVTPDYETLHVSGPEHRPEFEVRVTVAGRELASARAGNRKAAEKEAATLALQRLRMGDDSDDKEQGN